MVKVFVFLLVIPESTSQIKSGSETKPEQANSVKSALRAHRIAPSVVDAMAHTKIG